MMSDYKDVPISVARGIAEEFDKDQVIVVSWDDAFQMVHVTTYGRDKISSIQAAQGGNFVKQALGWPEHLCRDVPEWWVNERTKLLDALKSAVAILNLEGEGPWPKMVVKLRAVIAEVERSEKD